MLEFLNRYHPDNGKTAALSSRVQGKASAGGRAIAYESFRLIAGKIVSGF
jgi:hypothetical protein